MDIFKCIGISKFGLTENIEKRIIIARGGISHTNACVGGVDNGSNERLCCSSGNLEITPIPHVSFFTIRIPN